MDGKMKGMIMAGMTALCLILGIMGALGDSWLTLEEEDSEATYSLTAMHMDAEDAEMMMQRARIRCGKLGRFTGKKNDIFVHYT